MLCVRCHVGLSFSSLPVCVPRRSMCKVSWKALKQRLIDHMGDRNAIFPLPVFAPTRLFLLLMIYFDRIGFLCRERFFIRCEYRARDAQKMNSAKLLFLRYPNSKMESSFEGFDWFTLCNSFSHPLDGSLSPIPQAVSIASLSPSIYIFTSHEQEGIKWKQIN